MDPLSTVFVGAIAGRDIPEGAVPMPHVQSSSCIGFNLELVFDKLTSFTVGNTATIENEVSDLATCMTTSGLALMEK